MTAAPASPGRTLGDYLDVLKRHRWILAGLTALGLAAGAGYAALSPRQFESDTSVLVQLTGAEEASLSQGRTKGEINLDTEAQLVKSTEVATLAAKALGGRTVDPAELASHVKVTVPPNTAILTIVYTSDSPGRAKAGAEAFAEAYLMHRAASAYSRLSEQADATESELEVMRSDRDDLSDKLDSLDPTGSRYAAVKNDLNILDNEIADLTTQNSQLRTAAESVGSGRVISEAGMPSNAISPHALVNVAGGGVLGLLLALCVIAVRQRFAQRVWNPSDLPRRCDVEVLASLPRGLKAKATDVFGAFGQGGRVFGKLRNEVVAALGDSPQVIVVAGVAPGSASSVVCANLAAALARTGDSVAAVATHPGGPITVTSLLGVPAVPGLSDVLAERVRLASAIHRAARQPMLDVIGPGGCANAAGPSRDTIAELYIRLRDRVSYVVVDASPMSVSAEAQLLASAADAVILAVECGRDRIADVLDAVQAVRRIDAQLLGTVVLPRSAVPATVPLDVPATEQRRGEKSPRRPAPRPREREGSARDAMASPDDTPTESMPVVDDISPVEEPTAGRPEFRA